jgi:hypothetical protein
VKYVKVRVINLSQGLSNYYNYISQLHWPGVQSEPALFLYGIFNWSAAFIDWSNELKQLYNKNLIGGIRILHPITLNYCWFDLSTFQPRENKLNGRWIK